MNNYSYRIFHHQSWWKSVIKISEITKFGGGLYRPDNWKFWPAKVASNTASVSTVTFMTFTWRLTTESLPPACTCMDRPLNSRMLSWFVTVIVPWLRIRISSKSKVWKNNAITYIGKKYHFLTFEDVFEILKKSILPNEIIERIYKFILK